LTGRRQGSGREGKYVHEDVEGESPGDELGGEGAHGGHGGEVEHHDVELGLGRLGEDGVPQGLGGGEAPDGHDDVRPSQRQRPRRLGADATGRPWIRFEKGWCLGDVSIAILEKEEKRLERRGTDR
jgi:hypothetical protein